MIEIKTTIKSAHHALKPAFRACPEDYHTMLDEITAGRVSIYRVFDTSHDVLIAGEVIGDCYFIWGAVGRGLINALLELKAYIRAAGLKEMSAITHFPAVVRLCQKTCEIEAGTISNIRMGV